MRAAERKATRLALLDTYCGPLHLCLHHHLSPTARSANRLRLSPTAEADDRNLPRQTGLLAHKAKKCDPRDRQSRRQFFDDGMLFVFVTQEVELQRGFCQSSDRELNYVQSQHKRLCVL